MADPRRRGATLTEITVEGFRGIGPRRSLRLTPGPGLTLVVGRNGSGKSSFAEGVEILLTGVNWRWRSDRSNVWREGWRNLHQGEPTQVSAKLAVEGEAEPLTLTRTWPAGADLTGSSLTVASTSKDGPRSLGELGWSDALEPYRPFLSYNELGSMFDEGPTRLHDRLMAILGLGEYDVLAAEAREQRLTLDRGVKQVKDQLPALLARLDAVSDPRASRAAFALRKRPPDLEAAEKAAGTGVAAAGELAELELLRDLMRVPVPSVDEVLATVEELRDLSARGKALEQTPARRAGELARLLRDALAFHDLHAGTDCPVCGTPGVLTQAWRDETKAQLTGLDELSAEWQELVALARTAQARANRFVTTPLPSLERAAQVGLGRDAGILVTAWAAFQARPDTNLADLADHLEATIDPVAAAADALRDAARTELERREGLWRPVAQELVRWLAEARVAYAGAAESDRLKAEEKRLKEEQARLKQERFAPIADRAIEAWNVLRQQSNIDLEKIVLAGEGARRRVDMSVTVDGVEGAALGVMSQGELHAIALSLFLPRATLDESPFRFVVIDDPVQSMDPARVDGLAQVLDSVARTRQVIVFTHDDRLPEAVRRLDIEAVVLEVTRREGSIVEVLESNGPVSRHLADADAVAADASLPVVVAQQVVPGLCRAAIEAACVDVIRRRRLSRGESHARVEELLDANPKTGSKVALAIFDNAGRAGEVPKKLAEWGDGPANAFKVARDGAHAGFRGDLDELIRGTRILCSKLRTAGVVA
jgi:recombinational DNA repair ATPase RecF